MVFYSEKIIFIMCLAPLILFAEIDLNTNIYNAADEIIRMDEKMNQAIAQHNELSIEEDLEMRLTDRLIEDFEETEGGYILEQKIEDSNTEIEVTVNNKILTVSTSTLEKEFIELEGGQSSEMVMSSSNISLFIPDDADENQMQKSYEHGILKIFFPKKTKI